MIIPNWQAPANVKAFASTREGGVSMPPYQGLNVGMHVGDDPELVAQNRQWLMAHSGMPSAPVWLNQTHSTHVVTLDSATDTVLDADGALTRQTGIVCSAMTADCLPVLLTNREGTEVAAVHAGWRGLLDGIVENAVRLMSGELMAWIGPAISVEAFEVGQEVRDQFVAHDSQAQTAFSPGRQPGKYMADMNRLVEQRLQSVGVTAIYQSGLCTYRDADRFYSYRRDGVTGRQASFIWLES